jgi:hypothetical protein
MFHTMRDIAIPCLLVVVCQATMEDSHHRMMMYEVSHETMYYVYDVTSVTQNVDARHTFSDTILPRRQSRLHTRNRFRDMMNG